MKKINKAVSKILIFLLIISCFYNGVLAKDQNNLTAQVKQNKIPKIISEIENKRDKNVKHFLKDDGTFEAVIYPNPVHYLDNGKWKDIDNSLQERKDENNQAVLVNNANDFSIKAAKNTKSDKLIRLEKGDFELSWGLEGAQDSNYTVINNDIEKANKQIEDEVNAIISKDESFAKKTVDEKTQIKNTLLENKKKELALGISSSLEYNNILTNVNLRYKLNGTSIKEDIIVNKKIGNPEFKFIIKTKNLIAKLDKDKTINFYNDKNQSESIFKIQSPVMYDSNFKSSKKIEINLQKVSDGYELSIKPDKEWLDNSERTYPVYIDPPVQLSTIPSVNLCEVSRDYPDSNYQRTDYMNLEFYEDNNYGPRFDFYKFQLPQLTKSQVVTGASIATKNTDNDGYYPSYVNIYRVLSDWNPSTITWNNQPQHDSNIEQYQTLTDVGQAYSWDITQDVKDMYSTGKNYGLYIDMTADGAPPPISWWDVYPYYHYAVFTVPQVTINYMDDGQKGWLDAPTNNSTFTNNFTINGWALNYFGISKVNILVDGNFMGQATYGVSRPDVYNAYPDYNSTNCGYTYNFNIRSISRGSHTLTAQYVGNNGDVTQQSITIISDADLQAPTTPTNLACSTKTGSSVSLTWSGSTDNIGVAGYRIYRNGTQIGVSTTTNFTDTGLTQNTTYTYTVAAYDVAGNISSQCTSLAVKTNDTQAPTVPTNLSCSSKTGSNISLTWSASTDNVGVTGYRIYRNGTQVGTSLATNFTDSGLSQYTAYTYTIAAYDAADNVSSQSSGLSVTTNDIQSPTTPAYLTYSSKTGTSVALTWTASTDNVGVTGYKIYRNDIQVGTSNTTSYIDQGLTEYTQYSYTVTAYDVAANESAKSSKLVVWTYDTTAPTITLAAPTTWGQTNLVTANISDGQSGVAVQKWALGKDLPASYFDKNGNFFTGGSFSVSQNGIYTVYAKDNDGNETVQTVSVNYIYKPAPMGNYTQSFTDMSVTSPGINTTFERIYNSADNTVGPFGRGWTFSYEGSIRNYQYSFTDINGITQTIDMPNIKIVKLPDGSTYTYLLVNGTYTAYNTRDTLLQNSDGSFTLKALDKTTYTFNLNGYLSSIKDRNNNTVNIDVDGSGLVKKVTDTAGRVYNISYTADGFISTITDPIGRNVSYSYENGNLQNVKDPAKIITLQYSYDSSNYLTQIQDGFSNVKQAITYYHNTELNNGMVNTLTDSNGSIVTNTYDLADNNAKKVTLINNSNKSSYITYNADNQEVNILEYDGNITNFVYDNAYGDLLSRTDNNETTSYQYDSNGNITKATNPDGSTLIYTYDKNGNILSGQNNDGKMTYYRYDGNGNVILQALPKNGTDVYTDGCDESLFNITQYTYYSSGLINTEKDTDGTLVTYSNYVNGNPQTVINSSSGTTNYTYNILGWITSKTTPDGKTTYNDYNNDGVVIRSKTGTDITRFIYNSNGSLVQEIDSVQYDSTKDGLNSNPSTDSYNDANVGKRFNYDSHNNVITKIDANNFVTNYTHDNHNRVVKSVYNNDKVTRFIYNTDGKLIQQINPDQYDISKDGWIGANPSNTYADNTVGYRYAYNNDGDLITETYPNGQIFSYDSDGKVISVSNDSINAAVSGFSYVYDEDGNILTTSENGIQKVKYYYNSSNELIREDNVWKNQTITYTYDDRGNILTKSIYDYTTAENIATTVTYVYSYNYTEAEEKDKLTSYDGKSISYDTNGNMTSFNGWTYTWNGKNLATSTDGTNNISYKYTSDGFRTQKTVNGVTTIYNLDEDNNITSETNETYTINYLRGVNGNLIGMTIEGSKYLYEFNAQGDIIGLIDSSNNEVVTYRYDSWGKLISIEGSLASTLGVENPFRYRSYYYDIETGLYYLQSRYYNPDIPRFISKDDVDYHQGTTGVEVNLYAYCNDNPVMNFDPSGHIAANAIAAAIGAVTSFLMDITGQALVYFIQHNSSLNGFHINWWSAGFAFASGLITGALMISNLKRNSQAAIGAIIGLIQGFVTEYATSKQQRRYFDYNQPLIGCVVGLLSGYFGGDGLGRTYLRGKGLWTPGYYLIEGKRYTVFPVQMILSRGFAYSFVRYIGGNLLSMLSKAL